MVWFKQFWIIVLSVAVVCATVSCQELTTTLREGNRTCPGEEVTFTCIVRGSPTLAWTSTEYIGDLLQFTTQDSQGDSMTIGNVTATLSMNTMINGVLTLESKLHIVAVESSEITCTGGSGSTNSIRMSISDVPEVPQNVRAAELGAIMERYCRVLVTWAPPANTAQSDISRYTVNVPSQRIMNTLPSAIDVLVLQNCSNGVTGIEVSATNRFGCVGPHFEVRPNQLVNVPTEATETVTKDGSGSTAATRSATASRRLGVGGAVGITAAAFTIVIILITVIPTVWLIYMRSTTKQDARISSMMVMQPVVAPRVGDRQEPMVFVIRDELMKLYEALKLQLPEEERKITKIGVVAMSLSSMLDKDSSKFIKKAIELCLKQLQAESGDEIKKAFTKMRNLLFWAEHVDEESIDVTYKERIQSLASSDEHEKVLEDLIREVNNVKLQPDQVIGALIRLCQKLQDPQRVKDYYQKQRKHELGTENDRTKVPIWITKKLNGDWKGSLQKAVEAINEAAPGLSLSITEDEKGAIVHVLETDKEEVYTQGNIQMRLREQAGNSGIIAKIYLIKQTRGQKKGTCIFELLQVLGLARDPIWVLQANLARQNGELSELDKMGLNLVYRPCTVTARYNPKLGKNGLYYCERKVMDDEIYEGETFTRGSCGPDGGPNCPACRTIKSEKSEKIVKGGRWQGMTGRVYCGRPFAEPGRLCPTHDGACGMNNGPACPECNDLLNKES